MTLAEQAPELHLTVLNTALSALGCAVNHGMAPSRRLAVIDYSLPSSERRMWIFDLRIQRLLMQEYVAHGRNTGENFAVSFSNELGSNQSSLGLFRAAESYDGRNGYSLRLDGLERGVNDRARERAIVIHGADYVNPDWIDQQGRIGRSEGCPALREQVARIVIDDLKQRQLVFAYAEDASWLQRGRSFACDGRSAGQIIAAARAGLPMGGGAQTASVAAP